MALLPGSPAIGAGTSGAGIPSTDQRGAGRVGAVDIGAFESQSFTLTLVPGSTPQTSQILTRFANPLAVTVTANNPIEPVNGGVVSFVNPVAGPKAVLAAPSAVIAEGQATVAAAPNNAVGSYPVVASATGSSPVSFALTNTGPTLPSLVVNTTSVALFPGAGLLSLPEAIAFANLDSAGIATITFDPTVFATPQAITLTGSQLELSNTSETETITGPAAGVTVSGGGLSRVFQIDGGVTALISRLTISGGRTTGNGGGLANMPGTLTLLTNCTVSGNSATYRGGGLYSHNGTLTLYNCTVSGNSATTTTANNVYGGGGLASGGGTLTLTNCNVSGNSATQRGGGLANWGATTTLINCTVSGNSATWGGGLYSGGTLTLTDCTISGNSAGFGGGIEDGRGGTLTLTNCTVSGNSATWGGGGLYSGGTLTLTNCTVSGNSASGRGGGGVYARGATMLSNTIVAANTSGGNPSDIFGNVNANSSYNLIGTGGSGGLIDGVNHNQVGVANPGLGTLGDHGGPTQTINLLAGSPALNAGDPAQLGLPDQRGVLRTGGVNIGAYQASASAFVLTAPDTVPAGMPFAVTVTAADVFAQVAVGYTGTVTFSTTDPDPNVVLPPDYPFTLADQGRHTFLAGFTLQTPGLWTVTATDTAGGFAASVPITVSGGQPPMAPPSRPDFAVVDRCFAALPRDPGFLRLASTTRRGEDPSPALRWAARPDEMSRHDLLDP
jgi:predicted outer membrane repeat protein